VKKGRKLAMLQRMRKKNSFLYSYLYREEAERKGRELAMMNYRE